MYHKSIYNHDFINIPKKRKYTHIQMSKKNTNFNSNSFQPANSTNSPPIQPMIGYIYRVYVFGKLTHQFQPFAKRQPFVPSNINQAMSVLPRHPGKSSGN